MDARQEAGKPRLGCGMLSQPAMVGQPQRPGRELQYRRVAQASRPLLPLLLLLLLLLLLFLLTVVVMLLLLPPPPPHPRWVGRRGTRASERTLSVCSANWSAPLAQACSGRLCNGRNRVLSRGGPAGASGASCLRG